MFKIVSLGLCVWALPFLSNANDSIHIAVASNFRPTLLTIIKSYQIDNATKITLSSASSGVLYAQIKHGAPFDLFLSADSATAELLANELTLPPPFAYAVGNLVFWCPTGAPNTVDEFAQWRGQYALANPKLAPYGAAAAEVASFANWPKSNRAITVNNVAQVAQLVSTGHVDCGFIAKSLVPVNTTVNEMFSIPSQWHPALLQKAVVLPAGLTKPELLHFLTYLTQQSATLLIDNGYNVPSPDTAYFAPKDDSP